MIFFNARSKHDCKFENDSFKPVKLMDSFSSLGSEAFGIQEITPMDFDVWIEALTD